jgi:predicted RND superfamily exporter protein
LVAEVEIYLFNYRLNIRIKEAGCYLMEEKKGLALALVEKRKWVTIGVVLLTLFFSFGLTKLTFNINLANLLPPMHPFVKINSEFGQKFGGGNACLMCIKVKEGEIYQPKILAAIAEITDEVRFYPDLYRSITTSISLNKAKSIQAIGGGSVEINALMYPEPPTDPQGIALLKKKIKGVNAALYDGVYVSDDSKSTLISMVVKDGADFDKFFQFMSGVREKYEKKYPNIKLEMVGRPVLMGWIYHYLPQMFVVFAITFALFLLILFISYRSIVGVGVPIICGIISSIWGLGFIGYLGVNINPLLIVIPFLLGARALSHTVQITSRYIDEWVRTGDRAEAMYETIDKMLIANGSAIATDIAGFVALVIARVVAIQIMALTMSFWMVAIFAVSGVFGPILCGYMPAPKQTLKKKGKIDITDRILSGIASFSSGSRARWVVLLVVLAITVVGGYFSAKVQVGDLAPGSDVLWSDSDYNMACNDINRNFSRAGTETYQVFVDGSKPGDSKRWDTLRWIDGYSDYMKEKMPVKYGGTIAFAGLVKKLNMEFRGGDPVWHYIPSDQQITDMMVYFLIGKANPGDYAQLIDIPFEDSNVISFFSDHRPSTVNAVVENTENFIKQTPPPKGIKIQRAGGSIGLTKAVNDELEYSHMRIMALVLLSIFVLCVIAFRSIVAGILLMIPLLTADFAALSLIYFLGTGMTVGSLTVTAVGLGIGVNFGVYILARMQEEYQRSNHDLNTAILVATSTSGKGVLFTALTVIIPIMMWYSLSDVRFWGEMGLFLSVILLAGVVVVIPFYPAIVSIVKPKFIVGKQG